MDEDCYNIASPHHPGVSTYHIGHHLAAYHTEQFSEYQPSGVSQFVTPSSGFYPYEHYGGVSFL